MSVYVHVCVSASDHVCISVRVSLSEGKVMCYICEYRLFGLVNTHAHTCLQCLFVCACVCVCMHVHPYVRACLQWEREENVAVDWKGLVFSNRLRKHIIPITAFQGSESWRLVWMERPSLREQTKEGWSGGLGLALCTRSDINTSQLPNGGKISLYLIKWWQFIAVVQC